MTTFSHGLKGVAPTGLAALICAALASCTAVAPSDGQAAGNSPNLEVTSPAASDSDPAAGARFTLSATVRNVGDGAAGATTLRYYRSADATITRSDMEVGTDAVAELAASGTGKESVELMAPSTPGTYYYGACVDAVSDETDTTDNCSTSVQVTVQPTVTEPQDDDDPKDYPDMMVMSPAVSDGAPAAGAPFTLSATVRNGGDGAASEAILRYYQSSDTTITAADTEVWTDAIGGLAGSGSAGQSVDLTAPSTPGTYYYGACVDAVTNESDTTNNCSESVQVTVPEPRRPELMVTSAAVSDSGPVTGAAFTLSATVRNAGDGAAEATTLRYYRSSDATITAVDTEVGTDTIPGLAGSGNSSESVGLTAPSPGTYYYGACVDAVADETDTTNNCSTSVQITVQATVIEPQGDPDLTVTSPSVSDNGPAAGATFTLSATVMNDGDGVAEATTLRYYRSADATITKTDTSVGTDAIVGLAASGSAGASVELTAPSPGTYYYGACVDAVTDETDTTNNCSSSAQVTVPAPKHPDLTVTSAAVSDSSPVTGASITLSATVRNSGDGKSPTTTLRYYRSADATITATDTSVGTDAIAGLAATGSTSESVALTAPSTPGTYYYGACVDAVTGETDTTNNCSTSVEVTILQPDLVVGSPSVSESGPEAGAQFTLSATVENEGEGDSEATTLRYYRSTDTSITRSDTQVGTDAVAKLAASGTSSESVGLTAPSTPGTYYYGACVDAVTDESDTTNNCSASVTVTVPAPKPDLVVESPSVDESGPAAGETFTLSATVKNEGEGTAAATTLRYYRSTDATITTSDTSVGTDSIAGLAASGTSDQSIDLTAPDTAGTYYYGACVDAVTDESETTNNCSTSMVVTVPEGEEQGPSVEISAEDDKEWAPVGDTVDLSARVLDEDGEEVTGTTVSWTSSNTAVATVNSSGVMTAVGVGTVTLTATATVSGSSTQSSMAKSVAARSRVSGRVVMKSEETASGSVIMTVVKRAARIEVTPDTLSFDELGGFETLTATVYDADDNVMQPTYWGWGSGDREVADVFSSFGTGIRASVQALGPGTTTVTISANGSATGTATVTVTLTGRRVDVSPRSLTFEALGDTKTVTVRVLDENGEEDSEATWNAFSLFSSIGWGSIGDGGIPSDRVAGGLSITANGTGEGNVHISSADAKKAIILVIVYQKAASLEVSPDSVSLAIGGTATLTARIMDANGHDIQLADAETNRGGPVVYWSTSDSDVATVAAFGDFDSNTETGHSATVTAAAAGTATITGRSGGSSFSDTATVTVN